MTRKEELERIIKLIDELLMVIMDATIINKKRVTEQLRLIRLYHEKVQLMKERIEEYRRELISSCADKVPVIGADMQVYLSKTYPLFNTQPYIDYLSQYYKNHK